MDENYRIELRAYVINEIGGQGAHLFWVKVAPDGRVLEELHFVGQPGTKLRFLHLDGQKKDERGRFFSDRASTMPGSFFSYSGSKARIDQLWNIGAFAGRPLGPNLDGAGDGGRGAPRRGPVGGSAAVSPLLGSRNDLAPWMSEATASARKALTDLTSDSGFVDRYLKGGRREFDRFQGLMRTAYPEADATDAGGAETGGAESALEPWSPSISSEASNGVAPWLRDAFTSEATRPPGAELDAEPALAPWMDYRKPDWRRDSGG